MTSTNRNTCTLPSTHLNSDANLGHVHRDIRLAVSSLDGCVRGAQLQGPAGQADQAPAGSDSRQGEGGSVTVDFEPGSCSPTGVGPVHCRHTAKNAHSNFQWSASSGYSSRLYRPTQRF
jgi:hypothetical protein